MLPFLGKDLEGLHRSLLQLVTKPDVLRNVNLLLLSYKLISRIKVFI